MKLKEKKVSSLFVGRWQPFHKGHQKLMETVLKKGKPIVIAIRDTEISNKNPFSTSERWSMLQKAFKKYGELVKIVVIPDIDEICYGRDVGYDIRRIDLDKKTQIISGTMLRSKGNIYKPIIWLTGQSGAGKTTIAKALKNDIGGVILDGDEMRESISIGFGFSKKDRHEHNLRVARLAKSLSKNDLVIVSVIAPFKATRASISELISPIWVYVQRKQPKDKNKPYEVPSSPNITINSDKYSVSKSISVLLAYLKKGKYVRCK